MTDYNVNTNPSRMLEFKERLREKLVMEAYYKVINEFPTMNPSEAMLYAATIVTEKINQTKALREQEEGNQ